MWDSLNHAVVPAVNVAKCCRREAWVRPGGVVTGETPVPSGHQLASRRPEVLVPGPTRGGEALEAPESSPPAPAKKMPLTLERDPSFTLCRDARADRLEAC
jgi:hypothetical protein